MNGATAKPHKLVRSGDWVEIGGDVKRRWRVTALAERRGPASVARTLYEDHTPPPPPEPPDIGMPRRERGILVRFMHGGQPVYSTAKAFRERAAALAARQLAAAESARDN